MPGVIIVVFVGIIIYFLYQVFAIRFMLKDIKTYDGNGRAMWVMLFIVFPVVSLLMYLYYRASCIKTKMNSR